MNIVDTLDFGLKGWISPFFLVLLGLALLQPLAHARRHSYQLPDGVTVTMDVQTNQTVIRLEGQTHTTYKIESSEDLLQWVTLDDKARLGQFGVYTYIDARRLPKCFYRVTLVRF